MTYERFDTGFIFPLNNKPFTELLLTRFMTRRLHKEWVDENRYLDMELLREHLKPNTLANAA